MPCEVYTILAPSMLFLLVYKFPKANVFLIDESVPTISPAIPPKISGLPVILTLLIKLFNLVLPPIFPTRPPIAVPSVFISPLA